MTSLYQALTGDGSPPSYVIVEGGLFPIITDFRHWMYMESTLLDAGVSGEDKTVLLLSSFSPSIGAGLILSGHDFPFSLEAAVEALQAFFQCNRPNEKKSAEPYKGKKERPYDFMHDMDLIYAGFLSAYAIDLTSVGSMHWWRFKSLFNGLPPESAMKTLMRARLEPLSEKPTQAMKNAKEALALPERIRYFSSAGRKPQTEAEWLDYIKNKRANARA